MATAAQRRKHRQKVLDIIRALKSGPCTDCGVSFPHYVMEFDHRDGASKLGTVATLIGKSLPMALKEIEKCDLVCANCHKTRTHFRRICA
jgi:hypothetical protein